MTENNNTNMAKEYGFGAVAPQTTDLLSVEQSRAMHEVQAAYVIAKKFPRNETQAFSKIIKACERPFLAEQAVYAYPKGGKNVQGASIRLAEVLLQYWGNCDAGIREISQANGVSIAESYAIDLETNTRSTKVFHVSHSLSTKNGMKKLTDPREIYEMVANYGARRMRACILAIIPGDIVDAAVEKCKYTLIHGGKPLADKLRELVLRFEEVGIKVSHIEARLRHSFDITTAQEAADLQIIYKSIRDGMSKREDFFDIGDPINKKGKPLGSKGVEESMGLNKAPEPIEAEVTINTKTGEIITPALQSAGPSFVDALKQMQTAVTPQELIEAADLAREMPLTDEQRNEIASLYKTKSKAG